MDLVVGLKQKGGMASVWKTPRSGRREAVAVASVLMRGSEHWGSRVRLAVLDWNVFKVICLP